MSQKEQNGQNDRFIGEYDDVYHRNYNFAEIISNSLWFSKKYKFAEVFRVGNNSQRELVHS